MVQRIRKLFLAFILTVVVGLIVTAKHWSAYLSLDGFNHYHLQLLAYANQYQFWFGCGFALSYIVLTAMCIPGTIVFDLLAGYIYGPGLGLAIILFSYLSGAILNFLWVRLFLSENWRRKFSYLRYLVVNETSQMHTAFNLIGLRCLPLIPFWVLNIVAAIVGIRLPLFILTTLIGIIPVSLLFLILGHGVREHMDSTGLSIAMLRDPELWLPFLGLTLLLFLPSLIKALRQWLVKEKMN